MAICDRCGCEFNMSRVRSEIDNTWGSGRYQYVRNNTGDLCEDCASDWLYMEDEDGDPVDPENIIYPD